MVEFTSNWNPTGLINIVSIIKVWMLITINYSIPKELTHYIFKVSFSNLVHMQGQSAHRNNVMEGTCYRYYWAVFFNKIALNFIKNKVSKWVSYLSFVKLSTLFVLAPFFWSSLHKEVRLEAGKSFWKIIKMFHFKNPLGSWSTWLFDLLFLIDLFLIILSFFFLIL